MTRPHRTRKPLPSRPFFESLEPRTLLSGIVTAEAVVIASGTSATAFIVALNRSSLSGTVTFTDGASTTYGTVNVSDVKIATAFVGTAHISLRLPVGAQTVVATYNGDTTHASSHATAHQNVLPAAILALGAPAGTNGVIRAIDFNKALHKTFQPFGNFQGAINVAVGDIFATGFADLVVTVGSGGPPLVQIIDFESGVVLKSFFAFDASFTGGVNVAVADVNNDGHDDIVVGAASGGSQVKEFSGADGSLLASFAPFGAFTGGARVAAGDIDGDGTADVVVATGPGGFAQFKVFLGDATTAVRTQLVADTTFTGGAFVSIGPFDNRNNDVADIIVTFGAVSAPVVQVFDLQTDPAISVFFAYGNSPDARGGVYTTVLDVNNDTTPDFITNAAASNFISIHNGTSITSINTLFTAIFAGFNGTSPGYPLASYHQIVNN